MVWVDEAIEHALRKVDETIGQLDDGFPHVTINGRWITSPIEDWLDSSRSLFTAGYWTAGFWPGILWLAYEVTKDDRYKSEVYRRLYLLEPRKTCSDTHDLGFLFYPSFVRGYGLTGNPWLRNIALAAADSLSKRFNEVGGFISTGGDVTSSGLTAIDTMMNLSLLWWAREETGLEKYFQIALRHTEMTREHYLRRDGSTYHIVELDPVTHKVRRKATRQGYSTESCWSRGQAWGLYGFTAAYMYSQERTFLETAETLAGYVVRHVPPDHVPFWDFDDPAIPHAPRDSSAGAIMASGLLSLAEVQVDESQARGYRTFGCEMLRSLAKSYLNRDHLSSVSSAEPSGAGILMHGCFHRPRGEGVDSAQTAAAAVCLIWGDYYFLEGLIKLQAQEKR